MHAFLHVILSVAEPPLQKGMYFSGIVPLSASPKSISEAYRDNRGRSPVGFGLRVNVGSPSMWLTMNERSFLSMSPKVTPSPKGM